MNTLGIIWASVLKIVGVLLIVIGVMGLFLPIIPGLVLIFAGLVLLIGRAATLELLRLKR